MQHISEYLSTIRTINPQHKTNQHWLLAEEVVKLIHRTLEPDQLEIKKWLRRCKSHPQAIQRAMIDLKEAKNIKNRAALFNYLVKKYLGK